MSKEDIYIYLTTKVVLTYFPYKRRQLKIQLIYYPCTIVVRHYFIDGIIVAETNQDEILQR